MHITTSNFGEIPFETFSGKIRKNAPVVHWVNYVTMTLTLKFLGQILKWLYLKNYLPD